MLKVAQLTDKQTGKSRWAIVFEGEEHQHLNGVFNFYRSKKAAEKALQTNPEEFIKYWAQSASGVSLYRNATGQYKIIYV